MHCDIDRAADQQHARTLYSPILILYGVCPGREAPTQHEYIKLDVLDRPRSDARLRADNSSAFHTVGAHAAQIAVPAGSGSIRAPMRSLRFVAMSVGPAATAATPCGKSRNEEMSS